MGIKPVKERTTKKAKETISNIDYCIKKLKTEENNLMTSNIKNRKLKSMRDEEERLIKELTERQATIRESIHLSKSSTELEQIIYEAACISNKFQNMDIKRIKKEISEIYDEEIWYIQEMLKALYQCHPNVEKIKLLINQVDSERNEEKRHGLFDLIDQNIEAIEVYERIIDQLKRNRREIDSLINEKEILAGKRNLAVSIKNELTRSGQRGSIDQATRLIKELDLLIDNVDAAINDKSIEQEYITANRWIDLPIEDELNWSNNIDSKTTKDRLMEVNYIIDEPGNEPETDIENMIYNIWRQYNKKYDGMIECESDIEAKMQWIIELENIRLKIASDICNMNKNREKEGEIEREREGEKKSPIISSESSFFFEMAKSTLSAVDNMAKQQETDKRGSERR